LTRHELDVVNQERTSLSTQLQRLSDELQIKAEEKSLLQTRHDSLSLESSSLQKELSQAKAVIGELEIKCENEKQLALGNERALKDEHKAALDHLNEMVHDLEHRLEEEERRHDANMETWDGERRNLEARRERAEEKAAGLQRTIAKLQEAEGTLSGQEMHLREALASEKERHEREEAVLGRQIGELNADIETRRGVLSEVRTELTTAKEELRESKRAEKALEEKIQGLEDEIEISLEEVERATEDAATARAEAEGLRRQLHSVKQDLAKAETALADAKVEIETFREELQAGKASNEHLSKRLADIEAQLVKVKKERQALQDQLANVNIQMHSLRAEAAETEAERDEIRSQLQHTQQHVDVRVKLDQEKLELRRANTRLEADIGRSREESRALREENQALEKELELEIRKATEQEAKFNSEIADLRMQLSISVDGRDKELSTSKRHVQHLELRVNELESRLHQGGPDNDLDGELSIVRRDLADARANETKYLEREAAQKENIRQLRRKVVDLERNLHEAQMSRLVVDSPRSSIGSARKSEIAEVRGQLAEALQQVKELKVKVREAGQDAHSKSLAANRESQAKTNAFEHEKGNLEQELRDCREKLEIQIRRNTSAEQSISKLRTKVQLLETELRGAKLGNGDRTIAEERRDLHDMLKDAKIEVEDLQFQISDRDSKIESLTLKEKDLRSQLRRVREERSTEARKANATTTELYNLQRRYERALDKAARMQSEWEAERKAMSQRVRFPNTSISSVHDSTEQRQLEEQRHQGEIKGLVKQIQYLRSKCQREETFRADLAYSKKFFLMQIELYNTWYVCRICVLKEGDNLLT
jgi:chromosome segregation ATPase